MSPPRHTSQQLNAILRAQREREAVEREDIRQAIELATPPLPPELLQRFLHLFDGHVRGMMRSHAGFDLSERRTSYLASLDILERSVDDLISAIDEFSSHALADGGSIFERNERQRLQTFGSRIQKELFAATNAALSLVEHSRRVQEMIKLPTHDERKKHDFGDDGLHAFVQALRVLLFHAHMVKAGYNLTSSYSEGTRTATFAISKETLLRILPGARITQRVDVLRYLNSCPASIDLKPMFVEYLGRARIFHAWFQNELESERLIALRDYDYIMQEKANFDHRMWWRAMLGNWKNWETPPNPHRYLHKYLSPRQLDEVNALPRNSRTQVNLIIRYVDEHNAIDDELRELTYDWFARSPMDDPPAEPSKAQTS